MPNAVNKIAAIFVLIIATAVLSLSQTMPELPKREEIARVEIVRGVVDWYKPEELLDLVPKFAAIEERYLSKLPFQYGKFILTIGETIEWMAADARSITVYDGSREQMYKLKKSEDWFRIWDRTGKEGYIDANGRVVIKPQFDGVRDFSEGLAAVLIGDKWGYINRKSEVVIKPSWKPNDRSIAPANPFKEGLALVVEYAQWGEDGDSHFCGYIDKTGNYVIKPQRRRECRAFSDGLAWVVNDERYAEGDPQEDRAGYIDKKGNWVIRLGLHQGDDFKSGVARVRKYSYPEEKWYFIDKTGRTIPDKEAIDRQKSLQMEPPSKPALTLNMLKLRTIGERPNFRNIYGYANEKGKYVWLSPDAENHLDKDWIKANYIGN